jgi:hypothetical protein
MTVQGATFSGGKGDGGGASCSGGDPESGLVRQAGFLGNTLVNNDIGIALFNLNSKVQQVRPHPHP